MRKDSLLTLKASELFSCLKLIAGPSFKTKRKEKRKKKKKGNFLCKFGYHVVIRLLTCELLAVLQPTKLSVFSFFQQLIE